MTLLLLLLVPAFAEEITLPPRQLSHAVASISIRVADQTPVPGTGRVRLRLTVEGPRDLAVEGPWLEDAVAGWRSPRRASSCRIDEHGVWECTLDLVQVKPGVVALPGVRIDVHSGGTSEKVAWPDLLHESADVAPPIRPEPLPPSPWPDRLRWLGLVVLGLVSVVGVILGVRRWTTRPVPSLPPLTAALVAIERIEAERGREPAVLVAELDSVLRVYLETLGVPATRMTRTDWFRRQVTVPAMEPITALLARGEALKFAGTDILREDMESLAREMREVLQTRVGAEGS